MATVTIDRPKEARRLSNWFMFLSASWILLFVILIVNDTREFASTGRLTGKGNTLTLVPTMIRAVMPFDVQILGLANSLRSRTVAYLACGTNLLFSGWICFTALSLRKMRNIRRVRRAVMCSMIPFLGLWYGAPVWILGVRTLFFLSRPDVRSQFVDDVSTTEPTAI